MVAVKAEIAIFDNVVVLYKFIGDLMFFVTISQDENELMMYTVLEGFHESVSLLLRCVIPGKIANAGFQKLHQLLATHISLLPTCKIEMNPYQISQRSMPSPQCLC